MKIISRFLLTLIFSSCFLASTSLAATVLPLVKDMQPLESYVVDVDQGKVVFGLGSDAGVVKDDLFTVFSAGKKLTDPKTGKVLGQVETRTGVVGVVRVEDKFSYATPLKKLGKIKRGDHLVRFKELTAFIDESLAKDTHLAFELKRGLQSLNWQDTRKPGVELVFSKAEGFVQVKNGNGILIREYKIDSAALSVAQHEASPATAHVIAPVYTSSKTTGSVPPAAVPVVAENVQGKVRYDMKTYGYNQEGGLPFSAVMGDFLMINSQMHLVVIREHEAAVYQVKNKMLKQVAVVKVPLLNLLSVCWWKPVSGAPYIAVTGYDPDDEEVSSLIFKVNVPTLVPVQTDLPYILGSSDVDGDGQPETLMAQNFDRDTFFGRTFKKVSLSRNTVTIGKFGFKFPSSFQVTGGLVEQATSGSKNTHAYILGNRLHIVEGGREVYTSGKEMGGTASSVRYVINPDNINPLFSTAHLEIRPLAADIDGDGRREFLFPSASFSAFSSIGGNTSIQKSWLSVLKKTGTNTYMKGKIGGEYEQHIQAIGIGEGSLYLLTGLPGSMFSDNQGTSQLLVLPLQE